MPEKTQIKENEIFVGKKFDSVYANAISTKFNKQELKEITVKARGKTCIGIAVNAVEIARNRFVNGVEIADVKIGSDETENKEGRKVNVSFIEITLKKE